MVRLGTFLDATNDGVAGAANAASLRREWPDNATFEIGL